MYIQSTKLNTYIYTYTYENRTYIQDAKISESTKHIYI